MFWVPSIHIGYVPFGESKNGFSRFHDRTEHEVLGQLLSSLATYEQQIDIKLIQTIKGRFISKDFIKTGFIKTDFITTKDMQ